MNIKLITKSVIVVFLGLETIATITSVGKPRQPITGGLAAVTTITSALLMLLVVSL